ncbi:clasp1 cytoplasmic linker associated protein 1, partial [Clonorchis sinensis]
MVQKFGKCESCGRNHSRYSCPHRQAKCFICGKTGHIQLVCKSKKVCHLTSDPNTEVKALSEDISTLSLSILSQNSSHVFKTLISASGQKHDFIVDTGSVESIIPQSDLTVFYPSAVIVPTDVNIRGITGHSVPLVGSCTIPVRLPQGTSIDCNFLVSTSGPSIIGLKVLRSLRTSITLLTSVDVNEIKQLILKCSKATGGMQIPKVRLEVTGDPIFLKRRIIPFGLREPVREALNSMCAKGILTPVESSNWATPIVTPLKADGITPRICGDYRLTPNTRSLQHACTTEEPKAVLYRLSGAKEASSNRTVINTPFGLL